PVCRCVGIVLEQHAQRAAAVPARGAGTGGGGCRRDTGRAARIRRTGVEMPDAALERVEDAGAATGRRVQAGVIAGPVPVDAGIGVRLPAEVLVALDLDVGGQHVDAAAGRALVGAGAADGAVLRAEAAHQRRRGVVHGGGVPGAVVDVALVLDAQGVAVLVAHVPGGVGVAHHLRDLAVGAADHVVGADVGRRVLEPADGARIAALRGVDGHGADGRAARGGVVGGVGGVPDRRTVVGALHAQAAVAAVLLRRRAHQLLADRVDGEAIDLDAVAFHVQA